MEQHLQKYSQLTDVELWVSQRDLNKNLVDSIVANQLAYGKKYGSYTFPGALVIVYFGGRKYIIDGQHRLNALKILYEKYKVNIEVSIQIYESDNKSRIDELYGMLNHINTNNCMVSEGKINPLGEKLRSLKMWLKETYGYVIWSDTKTRSPYVNTTLLDEEFREREWFQKKTTQEIQERIFERNRNYLLTLNRNTMEEVTRNGGFCLQYQEPKARWVRKLF